MPLYNTQGGADGVNIVAAGTQTAGTTGTVIFSNSNNVTFGMTNSSQITASVTVASTQGSFNLSAGTTSNLSSAFTFSNSNGVSFGLNAGTITASHNAITTGRASTDAVGLNTAQTNVTWTVNSSGISLNAAGYAGTGTSATNASITLNSNGLAISVGAGGAGDTRMTAFATGNTTQSSTGTIAFSSYIFRGSNQVSVGVSNGSVIVDAPDMFGLRAGVSTGGNTAGSTGTVSTGNVVFVGTHGITLSQSTGAAGSAATITIAGPAPLSVWENFLHQYETANTQQANSSVSLRKFRIDRYVAFSQLGVAGSVSVGSQTNNSSAYFDYSMSAVLYTLNVATLSSFLSGSQSGTATWSSNATGSVTGPRGFTLSLSASTLLTPGEYWAAVHFSTNNTATGGAATTALGNTISMIVNARGVTGANGFALIGANTNQSAGLILGQGIVSTGATRGTLALSDVSASGSRGAAAQLFMELRNIAR